MRRILVLLVVLLSFTISCAEKPERYSYGDRAQYVDMSPIRPATDLFLAVTKGQVVHTDRTYAHRTNWRADWDNPTVVQLGSGAYFWYGQLRLTTQDAVVLSGCRGPLIGLMFNQDGSIPEWDRACWAAGGFHPRYKARPEVSLHDLLRKNRGARRVWQLALQNSGVSLMNIQVQEVFEYMDLDENGQVSNLHIPQVTQDEALVMMMEGDPRMTLGTWGAALGVVAILTLVASAPFRMRPKRRKAQLRSLTPHDG